MARIVVISGAGISAESGLKTFRDEDGLWRSHSFYELASPRAWATSPQLVLDFYNERRRLAKTAEPNAAHRAIAALEDRHEVIVITQNVDDLHERGGSSLVLHLHGELNKVRSTVDDELVYPARGDIHLGDLCDKGGQLRPHIVWFGEMVMAYEKAMAKVATADKVLVVGTSLSVYPAAGLLDFAPKNSEKVLITREVDCPPDDFDWLQGNAAELVPKFVQAW